MSDEQKIINLENEISFLKNALCEKQKEIEELNKNKQQINYNEIFSPDFVEENFISKDKIRERIKEARKIRWHIPKLVIEYFEEFLEDN
jgi:nicotinic acid mononucleotide adenylyltransferase